MTARLADSEANASLDRLLEACLLSLHQGSPGNTGANEVTGGGYARIIPAWNAGASRAKTNNGQLSWTVPTIAQSSPITHIGIWKDTENYFTAAALTDTFTSYAHGYANTNQVRLIGPSLPTGISQSTTYYVVTSATDTFQLSLTQGGAAINLTADGEGVAAQVNGTPTFRGYVPSGGARDEFTAAASTDTFTSYAHGLSNTNRVMLVSIGAGLPAGVAEETIYFVVNSATDTFQLSATEGGAAINLTADGEGVVVYLDGIFTSSGTVTIADTLLSVSM